MSDKLDVILVELQRMNTEFQKMNQRMDTELQKINQRMDLLEAGQQETNQIVRALRDGQEELKAQIEGISIDVHKLHGEVAAIRRERKHDRNISDLRAGRTERELLEMNARLEQLEHCENDIEHA
ncbi:hypothetical protein [Aneurinibacillus aneurinilyticus]|jgi:predicted  nucleic acid-binding Zn-ribbon protein|uniref:Uncharacterized protein n=1 Tax=Aneurinibacillus aneurinilyticus ATCC 12856 TaxID=649747 RepID=U1Y455_ANEAE|nr:hypothetical protein [Aneurinibacillus aneurinilyticus]ERI06967.1 hypothetical protein HMPREF0083_04955 [Aneurinibacillus aneurinilyticus ATCC 12856]MCI1693957.1 hypothetical protein [Aneurinibacillus aneurinilyticus]MED0708267.1 hypothetical protein [Aneurinibacillus aneurinilyticus]MED0724693.1 hypothetical protein [Aneurinibacillus aneurinilyticus]MED0735352.1 hypothetical protein [Aneurinibacillus aneurinilyticus]